MHDAKKYTSERKRIHLKKHERRGTKQKVGHIEPPLCIYRRCRDKGERRYIGNCTLADDESKKTLLEDYRKFKRARYIKEEGKVKRVALTNDSFHSALFKASFAIGAIEVDIMADQGADANFISERFFKNILTKVSDKKVTSSNNNQIFVAQQESPALRALKR